MRNKSRLLLVVLLSVIAGDVVFSASPAVAAKVSFGQKILPLNCVFTTINAGTGELYYVTPEACGVVVTPPPSQSSGQSAPPASSGTASSSQSTTNLYQPYYYAATSGQSNSTNKSIQDKNEQLPWQPLATVGSQSSDEKQASATTAKLKLNAATAVGFAAGLVLVVAVVALLI